MSTGNGKRRIATLGQALTDNRPMSRKQVTGLVTEVAIEAASRIAYSMSKDAYDLGNEEHAKALATQAAEYDAKLEALNARVAALEAR